MSRPSQSQTNKVAIPSVVPLLRRLPGGITPTLLAATIAISPARVIDVPPGPAASISEAVAKAEPGDVIQLQAGTYTGTVEISRSGVPDKPITIAGAAGENRTVIDGQGEPAKGRKNEAFRITDSGWLVIRDIDTINCWTNIVALRNSAYISIQSCRFLNCGNTAVSANGPGTHHILVENCTWSQDERVYSTWDWTSVHHEALDHYNGGLYGGSDAAGGCVIRFNTVHDVFNGLRWWLKDAQAAEQRYQTNIEIYDNTFTRCRDNCIEPEVFTWNLHIYHNQLNSCPAGVFSIDGIAGGEIYVYGNTGRWDPKDRPGPKSGVLSGTTSWAVFKFGNYGSKAVLDAPLYIYHNSWFYDRIIPRGRQVRKAEDHVIQYNNAFLHQTGHMGLDEWPGKDCIFDYDISSQPWSADVIKFGFEQHGIPDTDPKFLAPAEGNFRLAADSRAIDNGRVIDDFTLWHSGAAPDMGAYEDGQPVYGMPFLHRDPPGGALYQEMPRIVRIFSRGRDLVIFFSAPLDPASFTTGSLALSSKGTPLKIESVRFGDPRQTQAVTVRLEEPPAGDRLDVSWGGKTPMGINGQNATLWAADTRIVPIPASAVLHGLMAQALASTENP